MQTSLALPFRPSQFAFALLYSVSIRSFSVFISALVSAPKALPAQPSAPATATAIIRCLMLMVSSCRWLICTSSNLGALVERVLVALFPVPDLPVRFVSRDPVALLDPADQLFTAAVDHVEVVIGKLAPLLLDTALHLLPVALHGVPVHEYLLM